LNFSVAVVIIMYVKQRCPMWVASLLSIVMVCYENVVKASNKAGYHMNYN